MKKSSYGRREFEDEGGRDIDENDIYESDAREDLVENDELSTIEDWFMYGYEDMYSMEEEAES